MASGDDDKHTGRACDGYLPALDGLRAISIGLVLLSHAGLERFVPGGLGVLIFFVVSGFLLTRQMCVEVEDTGTLDISRFYLRRICRLAPRLVGLHRHIRDCM
jgi:peptidoglycan/LPS O-acetylase OafA/YrhL